MPAEEIFDATLSDDFEPSEPFLLTAGRATLDFELNVTDGDTDDDPTCKIEWYLEFTSVDPNAAGSKWYREVAEQNLPGPGTTDMPLVVRVFRTALGALLPIGELNVSAQLTRSHDYCRVQIRAATGAARARILSVFGAVAQTPQAS